MAALLHRSSASRTHCTAMTVRNLEFLFRPKSVAVVSEPDETSRYAEVLLRNLTDGGFSGPVIPVTAKRRSLFGLGAHVHIDDLDVVPELAIICTPLADVAPIIAKLGALGTRAVIAGPSMRERMTPGELAAAHKAILDAARPNLVRVLGPASGGLLVPGNGLNASVAPSFTKPGRVALIAQSTAIASAIIDRALSMGIGLSAALHLGAGVDIDLADVLDWFSADPETEAILVQFDSVPAGRKFMSAARAVARYKPVVAIRGERIVSGRSAQHPFSTDDVYEAAMRRAGWVRIETLGDLFEAAEAMARGRPLRGERLAILANGHGLGQVAADALLRSGGQLAALSKETGKTLEKLLRTNAPLSNPLALPAEITPENWAATLAAVLADEGTDAVLTVYSPSPFAPSTEVATAICDVAQNAERSVFTCWVGGSAMVEARQIAAARGVLSHDSPEKAVAIFRGIVNYERNHELLAQMPASVAEDFIADTRSARAAVAEAITADADVLSQRLARQLMRAYGIDTAERPLAGSIDEAIRIADEIGYPVDLGLVLVSSSDAPPVATGLRSPVDIQLAVRGLRGSVRAQNPGVRVSGYRLRPSAARGNICALRLGVADDPVFGPVIFLGPASVGQQVQECDCVVALPPLNLTLARDLVRRSRFARDAGAEQRMEFEAATATTLVRISQLLTDIDEVGAIEIDPLHVETSGVVALDVRVRVEKRGRKLGFRRFAIRPYPKELEREIEWDGRRLLIRPIRPEDEAMLSELLGSLSAEDVRMRFFGTIRNLPRSKLARFTQIDYDREMALVAIERGADGVERGIGEVRAMADPDNAVADFAIVVRSEIKGKGLGGLLLQSIIDYSRSRGTGELRGETLDGNLRMQKLARKLGFTLKSGLDVGTIELRLPLHEPSAK
jgi:acetyltransferase